MFILFRHEQYHFQKDLGAQLKLSGELSFVYSIGSRNSSVTHLSLHPEHIPEQPSTHQVLQEKIAKKSYNYFTFFYIYF